MKLRNSQRANLRNLIVAACLALSALEGSATSRAWAQSPPAAASSQSGSPATAPKAEATTKASPETQSTAPKAAASAPAAAPSAVAAPASSPATPSAAKAPGAAASTTAATPSTSAGPPGPSTAGAPVEATPKPATAGAASTSAPNPSAGNLGEPVDGATYAVRLRDLESRVDELKEQIRRSHTRLSLLSDTVLSGGIGGAEANVQFHNQLTNAYRVNKVLVVLDGAVQYKRQDDTGDLSGQKLIPMFSGAVPPGDHTLQVVVGIQGHGYGVFSYLRGYKFEAKSTHSFTISEGKSIKLDILVTERGGATTPIEERPTIRFTEKVIGGTNAGGAGE
jgi:hypothetical protein